MNYWKKLKQPPWRVVVPGIFLVLLVPTSYLIWQPGRTIRDGRHDLGHNGLWLAHGWMGANEWFIKHGKTNQFEQYRSTNGIHRLAERVRKHRITEVFPHLCPAEMDGNLPAVDDEQTERFLDAMEGVRVLPWIGGPNNGSVFAKDDRWRAKFTSSIRHLLTRHPRLAGVHLNVEPMPSGSKDFLKLLEDIRQNLPEGKLLSVAAYPPPTRWQPVEDVHWNESYFREVAKRCDQIVVMMYDTAIRLPKFYQRLMADWTVEVLAWSEGKEILLGLPAYSDVDVDYHHPRVENLQNALRGVHRGLSRKPLPSHYRGVALYADWEIDESEWQLLREQFLKR
jgi:hypothetical protein